MSASVLHVISKTYLLLILGLHKIRLRTHELCLQGLSARPRANCMYKLPSFMRMRTDLVLCCLQSQYLRMLGLKALASSSSFSWPIIAGIILASTLLAALSGIVVYRWRMQRQMQSEIHAIMWASCIAPKGEMAKTYQSIQTHAFCQHQHGWVNMTC